MGGGGNAPPSSRSPVRLCWVHGGEKPAVQALPSPTPSLTSLLVKERACLGDGPSFLLQQGELSPHCGLP